MKKYSLIIILYIILPFTAMAENGYSIQFRLPQLSQGDELYLAYYFGENRLVQDTAVIGNKGRTTFNGNEKLPRGMYFIVLPEQKMLEFILGEDQNLTIEVSDTANIIQTTRVRGSLDNKLLYEYQRYMEQQGRRFQALRDRQEKNKNISDSIQYIDRITEMAEDEVEQYWQKLAQEHSETLFAKILTGMNIKSGDALRTGYFFNDIDFSEEGLLRSPVIYKCIRYVLARNLNSNRSADFIIKELEQLITKTKANEKVYQYTVSYLLDFFNSFQRLGMNRVFVFIAENYVLNGHSDWYDKTALESISKRTAEMRASYIGSVSPNIAMQNLKGDTLQLHSLKEPYTLLFFWSSGCGHCEAAAESIRNFKQSAAGDRFAVFSVFTKDNRQEWEQSVDEFKMHNWHNVWDINNNSNFRKLYYIVSTPLLYVLNDDKEIIGFRAGDGPIQDLLNDLQKQLTD